MANHVAPVLAHLLGRQSRLVTIAFLLAVAGCSGGDSSDPDENLSSTSESHDGASADEQAAAPADEQAAAPADEQPVASAAPEASDDLAAASEPTAPPADEAMPGDMDGASTAQETTSAPVGVMEQPTDTVDAELTDPAPATAPVGNAAAKPTTVADTSSGADSLSASLDPEPVLTDASGGTGEMAPACDPKTTASPGAAKFITGTHEGKSAHKGKHHHHHGAVASAAGGKDGVYVVQAGDTLARIAQVVYGDPTHWNNLAELNGKSAPYRIFPGDEIKFDVNDPHAKTFVKGYQAGMKSVTVAHGDTLSTIAAKVLGSSLAWKQLLAYNKGQIKNPNTIFVGMKLMYRDKAVETAAAAPEPKAAAKAVKSTKAKKAASPIGKLSE